MSDEDFDGYVDDWKAVAVLLALLAAFCGGLVLLLRAMT